MIIRVSSIAWLLSSLSSAFQPVTNYGRTLTYLNEVKPAKNCYEQNPVIIEAIDNNGGVVKGGNTDILPEKPQQLDYSKLSDEFLEKNGLPSIIRYIDEDTLIQYLEAYESTGRKDTGLIVLDVREPDDIKKTGQFSPHAINWPYKSKISVENPFITVYDYDEWATKYEFEYPDIYERFIVLGDKETASLAAKYFMVNSHTYEILCYEGGSEEWFDDMPAPEDSDDSTGEAKSKKK